MILHQNISEDIWLSKSGILCVCVCVCVSVNPRGIIFSSRTHAVLLLTQISVCTADCDKKHVWTWVCGLQVWACHRYPGDTQPIVSLAHTCLKALKRARNYIEKLMNKKRDFKSHSVDDETKHTHYLLFIRPITQVWWIAEVVIVGFSKNMMKKGHKKMENWSKIKNALGLIGLKGHYCGWSGEWVVLLVCACEDLDGQRVRERNKLWDGERKSSKNGGERSDFSFLSWSETNWSRIKKDYIEKTPKMFTKPLQQWLSWWQSVQQGNSNRGRK